MPVMPEHQLDISSMSDSQQAALQMYTSVTNQEPSAAIPLLQRSQWNVEIAITKFFDGEGADPVEEARAALNSSPAQRSAYRETLLDGSSNFQRSSRSPDRTPAPRIVPQPADRTIYKAPVLLQILLTPFNILYRLLSSSFNLFTYLFPFLPRTLSRLSSGPSSSRARHNTSGRRPLSGRDTAARFAREFEEEYGEHTLTFHEGSYASAWDAAKNDTKFLLALLVSPEHDDTSPFVRGTLLSTDVQTYLSNPQNNILVWAGSVQDSEAYQVASSLNCTKFPFAALIAHTSTDSSTAMSVLARLAGLLPPSAFLAQIQTAIVKYNPQLERMRATRAEQLASRNLRHEQNSAYERSLAQDRERARRRREAEAERERAEREERDKKEREEHRARKAEAWKRWRAGQIKPEPGTGVKDATRVSIRLVSGERVVRKFAANAALEELYAFVECFDTLKSDEAEKGAEKPEGYEHVYGFHLVAPMPRVVYDLESGGTVGERVGRSGSLIVEPISEDEEEED